MGFFKSIGKAFKKAGKGIAKGFKDAGEGIKKVGEWTADKLGKGVEFVADKAGDVAKGVGKAATAVTGIKAFEQVGNKVNNFTDDRLGPAVSRSLTAPITALTGMPTAVMEQGLVDGIVHQGAEYIQDQAGSMARLTGGQKAEAKFDKYYDDKIQKWVEIVGGTVGRVALAVVPGGQVALAADAASEVASLGYRAGNGEKLGAMDYLGAGLSVASVAPVGAMASAAAKGAGSAVSRVMPNALTASMKSAGSSIGGVYQGAKNALSQGVTRLGTSAGMSSATLEATKQGVKVGAQEGGEAAASQVTNAATAASLKASVRGMTGQQMARQITKESAVAVPTDVGMTLAMEKGMQMYYGQKGHYDSNVGHAASGTLSSYGATSAPLPSSPHFNSMPTSGSFNYAY